MREPRLVLVTGGSGFIGSHVVDALTETGLRVRVLDALIPAAHGASPWYSNPKAEYIETDLADASAVARAVAGVDAVSHQAALVGIERGTRDAPAYVGHNAMGTAVLLSALAGAGFAGRFVLASSMVVYGEGRYRCDRHGRIRPVPRDLSRLAAGVFEPSCPACGLAVHAEAIPEDASLEPRSVYAATKLHQEHLVACFARDVGCVATTLRYHNVYGDRMPRDTPYAGVASIFRSALESGRAPEVFEDGGQLRDFVHVDDVAGANVAALLGSPVTGPLNIATGIPRSVSDMAGALADAFGPHAPRPIVTGAYRAADVRHVFASTERANRQLGFRAAVSFEAGMARFARARLREPVTTATT